jgi:hypothetical protein
MGAVEHDSNGGAAKKELSSMKSARESRNKEARVADPDPLLNKLPRLLPFWCIQLS